MSNKSNCCRTHGDISSLRSVILQGTEKFELKAGADGPMVPISAGCIAVTGFWINSFGYAYVKQKLGTLHFTPNNVCKNHQRKTCTKGEGCHWVHICRELWPVILRSLHTAQSKAIHLSPALYEPPKELQPQALQSPNIAPKRAMDVHIGQASTLLPAPAPPTSFLLIPLANCSSGPAPPAFPSDTGILLLQGNSRAPFSLAPPSSPIATGSPLSASQLVYPPPTFLSQTVSVGRPNAQAPRPPQVFHSPATSTYKKPVNARNGKPPSPPLSANTRTEHQQPKLDLGPFHLTAPPATPRPNSRAPTPLESLLQAALMPSGILPDAVPSPPTPDFLARLLALSGFASPPDSPEPQETPSTRRLRRRSSAQSCQPLDLCQPATPANKRCNSDPSCSPGPSEGETSDEDRFPQTAKSGDAIGASDIWEEKMKASRGKFRNLRCGTMLGIEITKGPGDRPAFSAGRGRLLAEYAPPQMA